MTRRDYVLLTEVIKRNSHSLIFLDFILDLADELAKDNPRFERERFLTDCGITTEQ